LGVAIEEMEHLQVVSLLLTVLGGAPNFRTQDFPYEIDIYPFPLNIEPLSAHSLAKYVYVEASRNNINLGHPENQSPERQAFLQRLYKFLPVQKANQIGSLYGNIIDLMNNVQIENKEGWIEQLENIRTSGEVDHFEFFKEVFLGKSEGLAVGSGASNV